MFGPIRTHSPWLSVIGVIALMAAACGEETPPEDPGATADAAAAADAPLIGGSAPQDVPSPSPEESTPEDTEVAYPEGPYGVSKGDIIEDFVFYDPSTGADVWLHQWYQHSSVRMLMIGSTAVW